MTLSFVSTFLDALTCIIVYTTRERFLGFFAFYLWVILRRKKRLHINDVSGNFLPSQPRSAVAGV